MKIYQKLAILLLLVGLTACNQSKLSRVIFSGTAQGTYYAITYYDAQNRNLQQELDSIFQMVDNSLSLWQEQSILSKINRGDTSVQPDKIFIDNFLLSKEISKLTQGYFDITIAPLAKAWGFHRKNRVEMTETQIDSLRELVDYTKVRLLDAKLIKDDPRISFDFNAVAPGYTVDLIGDYFIKMGIQHFLIDLGGEIWAYGNKPDGSKWRVAIESPSPDKNSDRSIDVILALGNQSVATSGSYRNYFEKDGKRFSHAIDPVTAYPVEHNLLSVTVLAENTAVADALATAFLVMGMEKSQSVLKRLPGVEAYFVYWTDDGHAAYATDGMQQFFVE